MKRFLLVLSLLVASALPATSLLSEPDVQVTRLPNGCLVAALEYEAALSAQRGLAKVTWARLLRVTYKGMPIGHAYCIFSLRNGDLYSYDINHGAIDLRTRDARAPSILGALRQWDRGAEWDRYLD